MRVAMIAPPWLSIPPRGYGGIEVVLAGLIKGLVELGVEVEVFGAGNIDLDGCKIHRLFEEEQYHHFYNPMFESMPIVVAHVQNALNLIMEDGHFDVVHDHNEHLGLFALDWVTKLAEFPPSIHTYHWFPFFSKTNSSDVLCDGDKYWAQYKGPSRALIVGVSHEQMKDAPHNLHDRLLDPVHNSVDVEQYKFEDNQKDYFLTLARFSHEKGQHIAVDLCVELGYKLQMAGTCASIGNVEDLMLELLNPESKFRRNADFRYYSDHVLPSTVRHKTIKNIGNVSGDKKRKVLSQAKALLFPVCWDEPFGLAVIEALASGTPVIAMNRGAMSELIDHGVTGFLANDKKEFGEYMQRVGEIDPHVCRDSVIERFSKQTMAKEYLKRYEQAIARDYVSSDRV